MDDIVEGAEAEMDWEKEGTTLVEEERERGRGRDLNRFKVGFDLEFN